MYLWEKIKQFLSNKIAVDVLVVFLILSAGLFGSWLRVILSVPGEEIYFAESFESGLGSWKALDGEWQEQNDSSDTAGIVCLSQKEYAAPCLMKEVKLKEAPGRDFVWHIRVRISSFTNEAATLGALYFPAGQLVLATDTKGNLALVQNLFETPVFSTNSLKRITMGAWQDIYVAVKAKTRTAEIYLGESLIQKASFKSSVYPLQEIWLGTIWLNGGGDYGSALDICYDQVEIGNEGLLPKPSFAKYTTNLLRDLWGKIF